MPSVALVPNGGTVAEPEVVENEGFAFLEWRKEGEDTAFDFTTQITEKTVLNAVWLGVNASPKSVNFGTVQEGYAQPGPQTVTLKNVGAVDLDLTFALEDTKGAFVVTGAEQTAVAPGDAASLTIQPKAALPIGTYECKVNVTGTYNNKTVSQVVDVRFAVAAENVLRIAVTPENVDFGTLPRGYIQPETQAVTVKNTGSVNADLSYTIEDGSNAFTVAGAEQTTVTPGETAVFTVQPNAGLANGVYECKVAVTAKYNGDVASQVVNVRFAVEGENGLDITVTPANVNFGKSPKGYAQPNGQKVTIKNTGATVAKLELKTDGNAFIVSPLENDFIDINEEASFTIQPERGLAEGKYTQAVTVTANGAVEKVVSAQFTVNAKSSGGGRTGSIVKDNSAVEEETQNNTTTPVTEEKTEFVDVLETDWFYGAVQYAAKNNLMNGTGNQMFEPRTHLTREMLAVILYNMEGNPAADTLQNSFEDVSGQQWYTNAILWCKANGIVAGYSQNTFGLGDKITREQLAALLYRYTTWKGVEAPVNASALEGFADKDNISAYAVDSTKWAVTVGIIQGDGTNLNMKGFATRAEVASMLMRYCEDVIAQQ